MIFLRLVYDTGGNVPGAMAWVSMQPALRGEADVNGWIRLDAVSPFNPTQVTIEGRFEDGGASATFRTRSVGASYLGTMNSATGEITVIPSTEMPPDPSDQPPPPTPPPIITPPATATAAWYRRAEFVLAIIVALIAFIALIAR